MAAAAPDASLLDLLRRVYAGGNSCFDADGNYGHRIPDTFGDAQRQALKDAGLQPNTFIDIPHDEAVQRLRQAAAGADLRRAADAFVASMVSSDLARLTAPAGRGLGHIAAGVPSPPHDRPTPGRIPSGSASDPRHLAGWHFFTPP